MTRFRTAVLWSSMFALGLAAAHVHAADGDAPSTLADESRRLTVLKEAELARLLADYTAKAADDVRNSRASAQRMVALYQIADLQLPESVKTLEAAMAAPPNYEEPWRVRLQIIEMLGRTNRPEAVPLLEKVIAGPGSDERWHAVKAVGHILGVDTLPRLHEWAKDENKVVRQYAVEALICHGDEEATKAARAAGEAPWALPPGDRRAILAEVIRWGRSPVAGPLIDDGVAYLHWVDCGDESPRVESTDVNRFRTPAEQRLLGVTTRSYVITGGLAEAPRERGKRTATARLSEGGLVKGARFFELRLVEHDGRWVVNEAKPGRASD